MRNRSDSSQDFLKQLTAIVSDNLTNPQFGVSMLAKEMGMSRSNLHRKLNATEKISVTQFIRQERLKAALNLLKRTSYNVSEICYQVGFNNVSYFIKCFHEYYGYSPGQVNGHFKDDNTQVQDPTNLKPVNKRSVLYIMTPAVLILLIGIFFPFLSNDRHEHLHKSIAVLPPILEGTGEEVNTVIHGTIRHLIEKLSYISELEVAPYTSVYQYRKPDKTIQGIAEELGVNYIVETYAEEVDGILHFQFNLIMRDGKDIIWRERYAENLDDQIRLYTEVTTQIAKGINARISEQELSYINKPITHKKEAERLYMRAEELSYKEGEEHLIEALRLLHSCIDMDPEFAHAHALLSYNFFVLAIRENTGKYDHEILDHASEAVLLRPDDDKCLNAMALYYSLKGNIAVASKYAKKALSYNPNSAHAYYILSGINTVTIGANPAVSAEYALRALKIKRNSDNLDERAQYYHRAAYSLRCAGIYEPAYHLINTAIELAPTNLNYHFEKSEIVCLKDDNHEEARLPLSKLIVDHPESLGLRYYMIKNHFMNREFDKAYQLFLQSYDLNPESIHYPRYRLMERMVIISKELNLTSSYESYKNTLGEYNRNLPNSYIQIYERLRLFCIEEDRENALNHLVKYENMEYFFAQHVWQLEVSPVFDLIRSEPEFQSRVESIKKKLFLQKEKIKMELDNKGLLDFIEMKLNV